MDIPTPKFDAWKSAEAELADIERTFRAMSPTLGSADREQITQQLAALRAARVRVALLFQEVMKENTALLEQLARDDNPLPPPGTPSQQPGAEDWLS